MSLIRMSEYRIDVDRLPPGDRMGANHRMLGSAETSSVPSAPISRLVRAVVHRTIVDRREADSGTDCIGLDSASYTAYMLATMVSPPTGGTVLRLRIDP